MHPSPALLCVSPHQHATPHSDHFPTTPLRGGTPGWGSGTANSNGQFGQTNAVEELATPLQRQQHQEQMHQLQVRPDTKQPFDRSTDTLIKPQSHA